MWHVVLILEKQNAGTADTIKMISQFNLRDNRTHEHRGHQSWEYEKFDAKRGSNKARGLAVGQRGP